MRKLMLSIAILGTAMFATRTLAGGDWSDAKSKVDRFRSAYEEVRKITPDEARKLVTAVCEAEEEDRRATSRDIASRVSSTVNDKERDLESKKDEAIRSLDAVIADDTLKDNRSEATSLKDDTLKKWETIEKMTKSLRGSNHPVVAYMMDQGDSAHKYRQGSSSYCDVSEFSMDSGRADCVYASDCLVIELKPDNSRAISKGRDQVRRYAEELNNKADTRKKLVDKSSKFGSCQQFKSRVDCYKLCPDIDSEGEMRSTSVSWRTDC